ncbi:MAG: CRISPR-associated helicase Cas3' [Planctomycetales bacterium]|nr:CRISPR-associated helicase Cas3' [Planctomycetales bacterium]
MDSRLMAKSPSPYLGDSVYLANHLKDVFDAASSLLAAAASTQLKILGLGEDWLARFKRAVELASVIHDLGKANDHFQGMIAPARWPDRKERRQGLRHEWVTGLMIREYGLVDWLAPCWGDDQVVLNAALWAVHGHHPKPLRPSPPGEVAAGAGDRMTLLLGHDEFNRCLRVIASALKLSDPPTLNDVPVSLVGDERVFKLIEDRFEFDRDVWEEMSKDEQRFVAAVKACVIGADVAGSALPERVDQTKRASWIADCFDVAPTPFQLEQLVRRRLTEPNGTEHELRPFQRAVGDSKADITFVKAGCGSGKTLAAYHWARMQCPNQRLYMCYPTTGTATEGFRDYLLDDEGDLGAELFHSRASVDWEMLMAGTRGKDDDSDESDQLDRIESLAAWSTPIVSCTVDLVLGLVQNHRRGIYAWPALTQSAFVFDEIHAYDDRLFSSLLQFIKAMRGVRILLMTASLPEHRGKKLDKLHGDRMVSVSGPENLETLKRYHRLQLADTSDPLDAEGSSTSALMDQVCDEVTREGKVLWVCNTVDRVMRAAKLVEETLDIQPIIYHSRFRYEDRVAQHSEVISRFKSDGATLAITSQVCEMSLDLSATMLVTDLAPISTLIQRLGRLNRRAQTSDSGDDPPTMPFFVIQPSKDGKLYSLPYKVDELDAARGWIAALPKSISQRDLVGVWEHSQQQQRVKSKQYGSKWLDGGPRTEVGDLRDPGYGITVIMQDDLQALRDGEVNLARVLLPMPSPPKQFSWREWTRYKGVPIAPHTSMTYDRARGGEWSRGGNNG